jgi:hypothetical protein
VEALKLDPENVEIKTALRQWSYLIVYHVLVFFSVISLLRMLSIVE